MKATTPSMGEMIALIERNTSDSGKTSNVKRYKTLSRARAIAERLSIEVMEIHGTRRPAKYSLIRHEGYIYPVIYVNELVSRPDAKGGYIAHVASKGVIQL